MHLDCGTRYARSKWLGEHACWAAKKNGEAVVVVRPGCIMGHSVTGASNQKDWFAGYLAACVGTANACNTLHFDMIEGRRNGVIDKAYGLQTIQQ